LIIYIYTFKYYVVLIFLKFETKQRIK
jgi:hypothetical protein